MATPIEANRPPNASLCCWLTPASSTSTPTGMLPSASSASIVDWTDADTAPVSSLRISAVIRAAGAWSMRVMLPWTSACSTVATCSSGTLVDGPDRQLTQLLDRRRNLRVDLHDEVDRLSRFEGDLGDGLGDERVADLVRHLGGGQPDGDGLRRVDRDLDLGRGLDQVALEVGERRVVFERGQDGGRRGRHLLAVLRADDDRSARWR